MRLASLNDLKSFLEKIDSDHDSLLGLILDSVSISFEGYTGRRFEKQSMVEYFDTGGKMYKLSAYPIDQNFTTVLMINNIIQTEGQDYFIYHQKGYIEFGVDTVWVEPKEISISYTGGYSLTAGSGRVDVPADLSFACLIQAAYIFRNRKNMGMLSVSMPDGSVNINSQEEFLPNVISVLERYIK